MRGQGSLRPRSVAHVRLYFATDKKGGQATPAIRMLLLLAIDFPVLGSKHTLAVPPFGGPGDYVFRMENEHTISGLMRKREELSRLLKFHQAEIRKVTCDLDHLDATIALFDPSAHRPALSRFPTKHRAHKGEMSRFVLKALREATGPINSLEITQAMVQARGLKADDQTVVLMRKRVGACLTKLKRDNTVREVPQAGEYKGWELAR